jgi:hypothetical protein
MPIIQVSNLGSQGIIKDLPYNLLPPEAWTEGINIRFRNGGLEKIYGHKKMGTPEVPPYWLRPVSIAGIQYLMYAGLEKVYLWDGDVHTNITRQTTGVDVNYTGDIIDIWNGGLLNGVPFLNNGVNAPQMLVGSKLEALQWDGGDTWEDKGYTTKVLRPYKQFLVALNWFDGVDRFPTSVYWSNQAEPLTVPADWDFADTGNEAGTFELAATQGNIIDGEQLRDQFMIYKSDGIFNMSYTGGTWVMDFKDVSLTTGIMAQRCAKEFYGRHFVFGVDDVFVTDGQTIESVANRKIRSTLFSSVDPTYYVLSFVTRNLSKQEMWICYPESGSIYPNMAAIWNWQDNTWSFRELPANLYHISFGIIPSNISDSWDDDIETWQQDMTRWDANLYNPAEQKIFGATANSIYMFDVLNTFDGSSIESRVYKEDLVIESSEVIKQVTSIVPYASGGTFKVYIGSKYTQDEDYTWQGPYTFNPEINYKIDVRCTGRYHAVRFEFTGNEACSLQKYDLKYEMVGYR